MSVRIGHASIDENGKGRGGAAGDQTGKEVLTRDYYEYKNGWSFVLRPKSAVLAELSAKACEAGCKNNYIGYDMDQRNTLNTQAAKVGYDLSKIKTKCETDCSAFMTVCAIAGGATIEYGKNAPTTSTMRSAFTKNGDYEILTASKYLTTGAHLRRGDILVCEGHHTVMALSNGKKSLSIIDISHYHPITDWKKAKANCPVIISKATQRTNYVDPTLESFIAGCEANKIHYWLYTYLEKGGTEKAQAQFMVKTCKPLVGEYFVGYILDVENGNNAADVKAALDYLNGLGYKTMLYTMFAQYSKYKSVIEDRGNNCAWWEARYGVNNGEFNTEYPCHNGVDLYQYTSKKPCGFATGYVDDSRLTGTKDWDWFKTSTVTTVKTVKIAEPTIRKGSTGDNVKTLQKNLNTVINAGLVVDGEAGTKTVAAIMDFQEKVFPNDPIEWDGVYGKKTYEKMKTVIK